MNPSRRDLLALAGAMLAGPALAGCLGGLPALGGPEPTLVASDRERETDPDVDPAAVETLVHGNTAFAVALLDELASREPGSNLFLSPYSVSVALAMTWAGARDETATQMADALRFPFDQDRLHPAFNALDLELDERGTGEEGAEDEEDAFVLNLVNAIWGLEGYPFRESFLDTLAVQYGAGLRVVDFVEDPEGARRRINDWVASQTNDRIEDLLPAGAVDQLTRLVLTNAVYFRAAWQHQFDAANTRDRPFTALDGTESAVATMHQRRRFPYAEVDGHQVVELPYVGGSAGMVVVLPAEGALDSFERDLDADRLAELVDALEPRTGSVALPKFTFESTFGLKGVLSALGMPVAFDLERADFGGIADTGQAGEDLAITDVLHKSFVAVDEEGTEAAAATGVVVGGTSAPTDPFEMAVDRSFHFLVRDRETGTVLFYGRVVDAAAAQ